MLKIHSESLHDSSIALNQAQDPLQPHMRPALPHPQEGAGQGTPPEDQEKISNRDLTTVLKPGRLSPAQAGSSFINVSRHGVTKQ